MKKKGIRIFLALVLSLVMVIGTVGAVEAAKPIKSYVDITNIVEGRITCNFGWNKAGNIWSFDLLVQQGSSGPVVASFSQTFSQRIPQSTTGGFVFDDPDIVAGHTYYVILYLYDKNGRFKKNLRAYDLAGL